MKAKDSKPRILIGDHPEEFLKGLRYDDSTGDFSIFWQKYRASLNESAEKKIEHAAHAGFFKLAGWVAAFVVLAGFGWFGVLQIGTLQSRAKAERGEALVVSWLQGKVEVRRTGSVAWRPASVEERLAEGDQVRTAADSSCELQIIRRGVFQLERDSELRVSRLRLERNGHSTRLELGRGGIALAPSKLQPNDSFEVATSITVASVRGTRFLVRADTNGDTRIAVTEGCVSLSPILPLMDQSLRSGKIDSSAVEVIRAALGAGVKVTPGEEASLTSEETSRADRAVAASLETVARGNGPLTAAALTNTGKPGEIPPISNIVSSIAKAAAPLSSGNASPSTNAPAAANTLFRIAGVSEEAKKSLDTVTTAKVLDKLSDAVRVKIDSKPEGADIFIDGSSVGKTPSEPLLEAGRGMTLRLVRPGYDEVIRTLTAGAGLSIEETLREASSNPATNGAPVSNGSPLPSSATQASVRYLPGDIVFKKSGTYPTSEREILLFHGKLFVSVNNRLLVLSTEGEVLKNQKVAPEGISLTRPVSAGDLVVVGSDAGGLYAYDSSGELSWKNREAGIEKYNAYPASSGGLIAVPTMDKGIQLFDREGKLVESIPLADAVYSAPCFTGEGKILIFGTENGDVTAREIASKKTLWSVAPVSKVLYPIVGDGERVAVIERGTGTVIALQAFDGSKLWSREVPEIRKTRQNPVVSDGKLILSESGPSASGVIVLSMESGAQIAKAGFEEGISRPFAFDGKLFVGTASGKIYSYPLSGQKADWTSGIDMPGAAVVADADGVYTLSPAGFAKIVR